MRRELVRLGVPDRVIFTDHAGFATLDSVVRARKVFDVKSAIIVTQPFHMARALWLAHRAGLKAYGLEAGAGRDYGSKGTLADVREVLARTKAVGDVVTGAQPEFLGPQGRHRRQRAGVARLSDPARPPRRALCDPRRHAAPWSPAGRRRRAGSPSRSSRAAAGATGRRRRRRGAASGAAAATTPTTATARRRQARRQARPGRQLRPAALRHRAAGRQAPHLRRLPERDDLGRPRRQEAPDAVPGHPVAGPGLRRAGPARPRVRARLRAVRVVLHLLHGQGPEAAPGRVPAHDRRHRRPGQRPPADRLRRPRAQPQRRPAHVRPGPPALRRDRRRRRRQRPARRARQRAEPRLAARQDPADRPRQERQQGLHHPGGQPVRQDQPAPGPRSTPTACATRGASASTARPATSRSATSARTRSRRSTSPAAAPRAAATTAGGRGRGGAATSPASARPARGSRS